MPKMTFRARRSRVVPDAWTQVQHYEKLAIRTKKFVGLKWNPLAGPELPHPDPGVGGSWKPGAFEPLPEPETIEVHPAHKALYVEAVQRKELWPGDAATALACGVDFDPKFGGEYDAPAPVPVLTAAPAAAAPTSAVKGS